MDPMFSCYDDSSGLIPTTPTFAWNPLLPSPPSTVHPAQSTSEHSEGDNSTSTNSGEYRDRLDSVGSTVREPNAGKTCVACRGKHLKCSGTKPCSRCVATGIDCVVIPSRRGRRALRPSQTANQRRSQLQQPLPKEERENVTPPITVVDSPRDLQLHAHNGADNAPFEMSRDDRPTPPPSDHLLYDLVGFSTPMGPLHDQLIAPQPRSVLPEDGSDKLLDSYYYNAFVAHPFVLPQGHFARFKNNSMQVVVATMRWIGSLYLDTHVGARDGLYEEAHRLIYSPSTPRDGFLVQAMMLLLVALDGCSQQRKAVQVLEDAEQLALEIGLHSREFASRHGCNVPALEESWRRTWWDLYIIDGMIAGVHRVTSFALYDVVADVLLPCEEHQYLSGDIPPPLSLQDLEDRDFCGEDLQFSSFAYRILSGQILGASMRMPPACSPEDANVKNIETRLTSWRLRLPPAKRDALHQNGQADEMMFQAYMMIHAMSITLHQPLSQLDTSPVQTIDACAPNQPTLGIRQMNTHTVQTISSASAISEMITWSGAPLLSHTHFFTCVLTLSSIVHLSRWALVSTRSGIDTDALREQIRLNMGALEQRSVVWQAAGRARMQVASVAKDIFQAKKRQSTNNAAVDEAIMGYIGAFQLPHSMTNPGDT